MAFPAIYSRIADVEVVNLGFPGLGKMELPMADLLSEIDAALYIVDCDWNMEAEEQQERYEAFVRRLGGLKPAAPILLCGGCTETGVARPQEVFAKGVYDKLKAEDPDRWSALHFAGDDAASLAPDADGTVDGIHLNDLGMTRAGDYFGAVIRDILR